MKAPGFAAVITCFVSGTGDSTLPVFIFGVIRRGTKPEINAMVAGEDVPTVKPAGKICRALDHDRLREIFS